MSKGTSHIARQSTISSKCCSYVIAVSFAGFKSHKIYVGYDVEKVIHFSQSSIHSGTVVKSNLERNVISGLMQECIQLQSSQTH